MGVHAHGNSFGFKEPFLLAMQVGRFLVKIRLGIFNLEKHFINILHHQLRHEGRTKTDPIASAW